MNYWWSRSGQKLILGFREKVKYKKNLIFITVAYLSPFGIPHK